jgi:hypothetical protein
MGGVVSTLATVAAAVVPGLLGLFGRRRVAPNPVLGAIEDEHARREEAERDAAAARVALAESQTATENSKTKADEADAARIKAEEDIRQMRAKVSQMEVEEKARRVREDEEKRVRDEAAKMLQDEIRSNAQEYAQNIEAVKAHASSAKQAQMEAEKQAEAAKREAAAAEDAIKKARAMQEQAKKTVEHAEKKIQEERAAREKAEDDLKKGVQPMEWPTRQQLNDAKRDYKYKEGIFHFAIAGISGSGKSSLINALRGYRNSDRNAAKTGIVETTSVVARYPDPNPQRPFAWYDIPGAGTLNIPDWQYFNSQGLYVFDCIIVLFDNRFTATDVAILRNCRRFNIPSYIVRSKSNQHIENVLADLMEQRADDEDEDEDDNSKHAKRSELYPVARDTFVKHTRQNVMDNLRKAELPPQRTYIISKDAVLAIAKGRVPKDFIDEYDLLRDILEEAKARRLRATEDDV